MYLEYKTETNLEIFAICWIVIKLVRVSKAFATYYYEIIISIGFCRS